MSSASAPRGTLRARDGAALVVSTVVGAGIFTVPSIVAALTGGGAAFLLVWVAGGALALAGALTYAELAARVPEAGGEYVYLREAFGPLTGFLSGWTSFVAGFSGAIAASAVGCAAYLARLVPAIGADPWLAADLGPLAVTLSPATAVALGTIAAFTAVAAIGVEAGRRTTNALALVLVVSMIGFIAAGLMGATGPAAPHRGVPTTLGVASALVPVMFTYSGWNAAAYVTNEFADARRAVPRALIGGTVVVVLLYLGVNATYLRAVGMHGVATDPAPAYAAASVVLGGTGSIVVTWIVLLALASSVCAMVVTGPRIYLQMARDGALPPKFGGTRPRDGNPVAAIVAQSAWSGVLVVTGTFDALVTYTGFAIVLFSGLAVASVFVLRRRGGTAAFRVPGYPAVPLVYIAAALWMLVATAQRQPGASAAGVGLIALGIPVYAWQRRRHRPGLALA